MPQPTHVQTPTIQISVINESTVLADSDVAPVVAALQKQVSNDFRPIWGVDAVLTIVPKTAQPPTGSWWLVLLDDSDQANALGYHDLTTEGLPIGKVFADSDLKAGTSWTVTASHELLEMLGDPNINLTAFVQNTNTAGMLYAYEVCDACEDDSFGYQIDNVLLSDFVYPSWFENFRAEGSTQFDRMNKIQSLHRELRQRLAAADRGEAPHQSPAPRSRRYAPRAPQHPARSMGEQPAPAQDRGQRPKVSPAIADHPKTSRSRINQPRKIFLWAPPTRPARKRGAF
jgi:hypothetical protein